MRTLTIDVERLQRDLTTLASFTEPGSRGVTRRLCSRAYRESREWLACLMADAHLDVRVDEAANLIGRRAGQDDEGPVLLVGSHSDTVTDGGAFDGALGVLAALEAARALRRTGIRLVHPLEVVDFLSEEVSDFGISAVGSRAMAGTLERAWLAHRAPNGITLAEAIGAMGGVPERVADATRFRGAVAAYLELHIEQGPLLWNRSVQIGVVAGIAGIRRYRAVITGRPDHVGTTPMDLRRDALAGAAEIVLLVERLCRAAGPPLVGTVGRMIVTPNVGNVIPGSVEFVFELRAPGEEQLDRLAGALLREASALTTARGLGWGCEASGFVPAIGPSRRLMDAIEEVTVQRGYSSMRLYSGAGHDASHIAGIADAGMIFVPCRDGRSHCSEEHVAREHLRPGVDVLAHAIILADQRFLQQ